jgi:hypothetical protein
MGIVVLSGHAMTARWHVGSVSGWLFWSVLVTSPEILIFLFFMITDPRTAPMGRVARVVYAAAVAFFSSLLVAPMRTEFATKVAILGGLTLVCAFRPLLERALPAAGTGDDHLRTWLRGGAAAARGGPARWERGIGAVIACAGLVVVAGIPARTASAPSLPTVDPAQTASRPDVRLGAGQVPPVTIDPSVPPIVPSFDARQARAMAHDLVADLVIVGDALEQRNSKLAATAAAGSWLLGVQQQIDAAGGSRPLEIPRYQLDRINVVLVRQTPQSAPEVALAVRGTLRTDTSHGANTSPAKGFAIPFQRTYVLAPAGKFWLIAADQPSS